MKWWVLALSLFCLLSMAEAGGRDSDGDGISDVGKNKQFYLSTGPVEVGEQGAHQLL